MSEKDRVLEVVRRMPDDAPMSDILQEIRFIAAIREAELQSKEGRTVAHEEVASEISAWASQ